MPLGYQGIFTQIFQTASSTAHSYESYSTVLWCNAWQGFPMEAPKSIPKIKLKVLRHMSDDLSVMLPLPDCQGISPKFETRMQRTVVTKYQALYTMARLLRHDNTVFAVIVKIFCSQSRILKSPHFFPASLQAKTAGISKLLMIRLVPSFKLKMKYL